MPRSYPRPPPEYPGHYAEMTVLPEIEGWTAKRLSLAGKAVRIRCRACGRDAVITPLGLTALFKRNLETPIDNIVERMRCDTCGAREAQASGFVLERRDDRMMFIRREHAGAPLARMG